VRRTLPRLAALGALGLVLIVLGLVTSPLRDRTTAHLFPTPTPIPELEAIARRFAATTVAAERQKRALLATATPDKPSNRELELAVERTTRLSDGRQMLSGSITNHDDYWSAVDAAVEIQYVGEDGRVISTDTAILDGATSLRPGDQTAWRYVSPLAVGPNAPPLRPVARFRWQAND